MTSRPGAPIREPPADSSRRLPPTGSLGRGFAGAAVGIAVVTAVARIVGFGRVVALARTVGPSCLGDTYQTANMIPNILFEVVAGGALASLVIPVLAGPAQRGDRATTARTTGALLSWAVVVLAPLAAVGAWLGPQIMNLLVGPAPPGCSRAAEVAVGARMLVVFMPQVVLYGIGIVLAGVLQAHRRFLGPALAPLLSSLVVVAAYLLYAAQIHHAGQLGSLPTAAELTLSLGTTLGVAALTLSLIVPLRAAGIPVQPTLRFPPGVARTVRRLALAGAAGLTAQQLTTAVVLRLAHGAPGGSVIVYTVAWTIYLLPWAVLAVPIATSVFPTLSASAESGDEATYADLTARSVRASVLVSAAAAAVLVAVAGPAARVLVLGAPGTASAPAIAAAVAAFAPGLVGYGLLALLGRALYARGNGRAPAVATVIGWLVVIGVDLALAGLLPARDRITAVGLGNTVGMTVAGGLLLAAIRRTAGGAALCGLRRSAAVGVGGGMLAALAGAGTSAGLGPAGVAGSVAQAAAAGGVALGVFGLVACSLDRADLRWSLPRGSRG